MDEDEIVKEVLAAKSKKTGRGFQRRAFIRWKGCASLTWEPVEYLHISHSGRDALVAWEDKYGPIREKEGPKLDFEGLQIVSRPRRRGGGG